MGSELDREAIGDAAHQLRAADAPFAELEALAEDHLLFEILGKWPPDGTLPVPAAKVREIARTLKEAQRRLKHIRPDGASERLDDVAARLKTHIRMAARIRDADPDSDEDDAGIADVVGPWPP